MGSEMDTFAARLASFDTVLKPEKRRSSGTKTPKSIIWPHQRPSPAELAHAGFYYKPYETNPDNTTCFECHRALDGWEEDDNPVTEHLKHAPDCGWAIMMDLQQNSSNPASIEDPTGDRITQARLSTFSTKWPHDGKKGWMVEGGWYFCPTDESNDLASCVYCKLSLDGWEPKDDPFDEHYRRSSDCSFFVFAQPPGKKSKSTRAKKAPRVSKTSSRLSTQSVGPVTSEAPDTEMDESMDQSIMSQPSTKSKSTKKAPKSKSKATKTKKEESAEVESQIEADIGEVAQPEPIKSKRVGRGKKRASEDVKDEPNPVTMEEREPSQPPEEPPAKKRATKTRSSSIARNYNYEHSDSAMADAEPVDDTASEEETKRGRKPTKKAGAKARKVSDVPVALKGLSKARAPRDSEIDAEIEAGLEADIPEPAEPEPKIEAEPSEPRASKKIKSSKKFKAVAKSPEPAVRDLVEDVSDHDERSDPHVEPVDDEPAAPEPPAPKTKIAKGSKKKVTKKTKTEETIKAQLPEPRASLELRAPDDWDEPERHDSFISVEIVSKEPEYASEPEEPMAKAESKKTSKKKDATSTKDKKSKKSEKKAEQAAVIEPPAEEPRAEALMEEHDDEFETADDLPDQLQMVNPPQEMSPGPQSHQKTLSLPPKTAKRYSDIPHEEHLAEALVQSQDSPHEMHQSRRNSKRSNRAVSPLPPAHQNTPSLSPQSSDAENRPPSSRPSASRPPVQSTPKHPDFRVPLAASTPSPSKRNANGGFGPSSHPWTPVDIDEVLFGEASDKENADLSELFKGAKAGLTSPEKKMTVQEWIAWNAKNGEERLKRECERLVGQFEKEGGRAMRRLEAIECID
ncbi:uncharacterized protein N7479_008392 [Penicillium vulpinum]|uniref:BIR-domain-containing protein n=1 Tax=Penicillium vulpinum TaxID=29845 RepID=A0A1V6REW6_9EURO|nr:uncharacterized protein N7479_008392 [Penicillium vulpinum]KAJ5961242.1 hypothetical protein N7479_008392 [Penicillium vulpinum]OQE00176.1 hypothetical protein PENVUL_c057G05877 [Penicillium vulpinum]